MLMINKDTVYRQLLTGGTTYTATLPVVVTGTVVSLNTDSLASLARRKDTVNFIVSKPYLTTYVANRFLTLGSSWLHGDTSGTIVSKSFLSTYATNRFLGLGLAWLHGDTAATIVSKSFLSTYVTNRFQPLGAYLTAVSGTNLDNIWSNNGILTRTGTGTYSYVTDNSTTWNSLVTFPGFGTSHSTAPYGDTVEQNRLRLKNVLKDTTKWNNKQDTSTTPFQHTLSGNTVLRYTGNVGIGTTSPELGKWH